MTAQESSVKVDELLARSTTRLNSGKIQDAANSLREALRIDPGNPKVKEALTRLKQADSNVNPWEVCQSYLQNGGDDVGKRAVSAMGTASDGEAAKVLQELLRPDGSSQPLVPKIIASSLSSRGGQKFLAPQLKDNVNETFSLIWSKGEDCVRAMVSTLIQPSVWDNETTQTRCEIAVFRLLFAKLREPEKARHDTVLSAVARLLAIDASKFQDSIDTATFTTVLLFLNLTNSPIVRGQATLALAKMLEVRPEQSKTDLRGFVTSKFAAQTSSDLTAAFSAATAVFPIIPDFAAELFLTQGFLEELTRLVEVVDHLTLQKSALELLSAACVVKPCREAISKTCTPLLTRLSNPPSNSDTTSLSILILSKLTPPTTQPESRTDDDLIPRLKTLALDASDTTRQNAIEALAYRTINPPTKEALANDPAFLKNLTTTLIDLSPSDPALFGGLTVLSNLVTYPAAPSAEAKRLAQLKAYANQTTPEQLEHPLNATEPVTNRLKKVLDAGLPPLLLQSLRRASPGLTRLIVDILLSTSRHPIHRRGMAQNGLLRAALSLASAPEDNPIVTPDVRASACLAVARALTSLDPNLTFTSNSGIAIQPAIASLSRVLSTHATAVQVAPAADAVNATVSALQALTNLATLEAGDATPQKLVLTASWPAVEDLIYSDVTALRRCAVELICNMATYPATGMLFFEGKAQQARQRLRILTGYFGGDDDGATRTAAAGALVGLLDFPGAGEMFLDGPGVGYVGECLGVLGQGCEARSLEEGLAVRALAMTGVLLYPQTEEGDSRTEEVFKRVIRRLEDGGVLAQIRRIDRERRGWSAPRRQQVDYMMEDILSKLP